MKKQRFCRGLIYMAGVSLMAVGTTLNTKTGLGVGSVSSLPYAVSRNLNWNFSIMVFFIYAAMIAAQFFIKGKNHTWLDLLQIPENILFSLYLELFHSLIDLQMTHLWERFAWMAVAILLTGVGVSLTVNMEIAPNPPDGLVYTISEATNKDMGLIKTLLDFVCVGTAVVIDLLSSGTVTSVGVGTVCCMIFIGRVISLTNRLFKENLRRLAGLKT